MHRNWGTMRKRSFAFTAGGFLLLALFAVGLLPRGGAHVSALTNCTTSEDGMNVAEEQMLVLINGARASAGLTSLKLSANLNRAAAWKSADNGSNGLGAGFSHTDSLGRTPVQRAQDCGYATGAAENIAYGSTGAETIFGMWMGSAGHKQNILYPTYKVIGIGQYGSAWTTDFGFVDDSGATSPSPATNTPTNTATPLATSPASTATPSSTSTSTPTRPPSQTASPTSTVTPTSLSGISLGLSAGMNLVTYGGETQPVTAALRSLQGYVEAVYRWDAVDGIWEKYAPNRPGYVNSFASLQAGGVYYIQVSANVAWAY